MIICLLCHPMGMWIPARGWRIYCLGPTGTQAGRASRPKSKPQRPGRSSHGHQQTDSTKPGDHQPSSSRPFLNSGPDVCRLGQADLVGLAKNGLSQFLVYVGVRDEWRNMFA